MHSPAPISAFVASNRSNHTAGVRTSPFTHPTNQLGGGKEFCMAASASSQTLSATKFLLSSFSRRLYLSKRLFKSDMPASVWYLFKSSNSRSAQSLASGFTGAGEAERKPRRGRQAVVWRHRIFGEEGPAHAKTLQKCRLAGKHITCRLVGFRGVYQPCFLASDGSIKPGTFHQRELGSLDHFAIFCVYKPTQVPQA